MRRAYLALRTDQVHGLMLRPTLLLSFHIIVAPLRGTMMSARTAAPKHLPRIHSSDITAPFMLSFHRFGIGRPGFDEDIGLFGSPAL